MVQRDWSKLLQTVKEDVFIAQSMVEAIHFATILPSMFSTNVTIVDRPGGKTVSVTRDRPISAEDLTGWALNVQTALLGMWILMVDQALEAKHGIDRLQDTNGERQAVRCVIYQVRCAIAHSSYAAKWLVGAGFQRSFTVSGLTSGSLTLDFSQLNGQSFKPSQFGGWYRVIELLEYAQQFL